MPPHSPPSQADSRKFVAMLVFAFGSLLVSAAWGFSLPEVVASVGRWTMLFGAVTYAIFKRSLTTSILVSMVVGIVIGIEFPAYAVNLQVLSKIFSQNNQ